MNSNAASILALVMWSPFYIVPTGIGCLVVRSLKRPRSRFILPDWLLLFVPWFVWFAFMMVTPQTKSLANLAEVYALIAVAVVGFAIRTFIGAKVGHSRASFVVLAVTIFTGVGLAYFVPALPE